MASIHLGIIIGIRTYLHIKKVKSQVPRKFKNMIGRNKWYLDF